MEQGTELDHVHHWRFAERRSDPGKPTIDVERCATCGETRELEVNSDG